MLTTWIRVGVLLGNRRIATCPYSVTVYKNRDRKIVYKMWDAFVLGGVFYGFNMGFSATRVVIGSVCNMSPHRFSVSFELRFSSYTKVVIFDSVEFRQYQRIKLQWFNIVVHTKFNKMKIVTNKIRIGQQMSFVLPNDLQRFQTYFIPWRDLCSFSTAGVVCW